MEWKIFREVRNAGETGRRLLLLILILFVLYSFLSLILLYDYYYTTTTFAVASALRITIIGSRQGEKKSAVLF